jgi:hypothetical protein
MLLIRAPAREAKGKRKRARALDRTRGYREGHFEARWLGQRSSFQKWVVPRGDHGHERWRDG